jgi:hypothetical protein
VTPLLLHWIRINFFIGLWIDSQLFSVIITFCSRKKVIEGGRDREREREREREKRMKKFITSAALKELVPKGSSSMAMSSSMSGMVGEKVKHDDDDDTDVMLLGIHNSTAGSDDYMDGGLEDSLAFGHMRIHKDGTVMTDDDIRELRQRQGYCLTCPGDPVKLFAIKRSRMNPLYQKKEPIQVNNQSYNGVCLKCNPPINHHHHHHHHNNSSTTSNAMNTSTLGSSSSFSNHNNNNSNNTRRSSLTLPLSMTFDMMPGTLHSLHLEDNNNKKTNNNNNTTTANKGFQAKRGNSFTGNSSLSIGHDLLMGSNSDHSMAASRILPSSSSHATMNISPTPTKLLTSTSDQFVAIPSTTTITTTLMSSSLVQNTSSPNDSFKLPSFTSVTSSSRIISRQKSFTPPPPPTSSSTSLLSLPSNNNNPIPKGHHPHTTLHRRSNSEESYLSPTAMTTGVVPKSLGILPPPSLSDSVRAPMATRKSANVLRRSKSSDGDDILMTTSTAISATPSETVTAKAPIIRDKQNYRRSHSGDGLELMPTSISSLSTTRLAIPAQSTWDDDFLIHSPFTKSPSNITATPNIFPNDTAKENGNVGGEDDESSSKLKSTWADLAAFAKSLQQRRSITAAAAAASTLEEVDSDGFLNTTTLTTSSVDNHKDNNSNKKTIVTNPTTQSIDDGTMVDALTFQDSFLNMDSLTVHEAIKNPISAAESGAIVTTTSNTTPTPTIIPSETNAHTTTNNHNIGDVSNSSSFFPLFQHMDHRINNLNQKVDTILQQQTLLLQQSVTILQLLGQSSTLSTSIPKQLQPHQDYDTKTTAFTTATTAISNDDISSSSSPGTKGFDGTTPATVQNFFRDSFDSMHPFTTPMDTMATFDDTTTMSNEKLHTPVENRLEITKKTSMDDQLETGWPSNSVHNATKAELNTSTSPVSDMTPTTTLKRGTSNPRPELCREGCCTSSNFLELSSPQETLLEVSTISRRVSRRRLSKEPELLVERLEEGEEERNNNAKNLSSSSRNLVQEEPLGTTKMSPDTKQGIIHNDDGFWSAQFESKEIEFHDYIVDSTKDKVNVSVITDATKEKLTMVSRQKSISTSSIHIEATSIEAPSEDSALTRRISRRRLSKDSSLRRLDSSSGLNSDQEMATTTNSVWPANFDEITKDVFHDYEIPTKEDSIESTMAFSNISQSAIVAATAPRRRKSSSRPDLQRDAMLVASMEEVSQNHPLGENDTTNVKSSRRILNRKQSKVEGDKEQRFVLETTTSTSMSLPTETMTTETVSGISSQSSQNPSTPMESNKRTSESEDLDEIICRSSSKRVVSRRSSQEEINSEGNQIDGANNDNNTIRLTLLKLDDSKAKNYLQEPEGFSLSSDRISMVPNATTTEEASKSGIKTRSQKGSSLPKSDGITSTQEDMSTTIALSKRTPYSSSLSIRQDSSLSAGSGSNTSEGDDPSLARQEGSPEEEDKKKKKKKSSKNSSNGKKTDSQVSADSSATSTESKDVNEQTPSPSLPSLPPSTTISNNVDGGILDSNAKHVDKNSKKKKKEKKKSSRRSSDTSSRDEYEEEDGLNSQSGKEVSVATASS